MVTGFGYVLDLGAFDSAVGFVPNFNSSVDVFTDGGSLFHVVLGAVAGYFQDGWAVALTSTFGGYELAKLSAGEPVTRVAGTWIEYGLGAFIGTLLRHYVR